MVGRPELKVMTKRTRFGPAVRVLRARFEIKQWRLAHQLGWNPQTLYQIEAGRRAVSAAETEAIGHAIATLAQQPFDEVLAMLSEEENRREELAS